MRPSRRVLIVEDDALQAEALGFLLGREGYQVETVATGQECLLRVGSEPALDVIVLDVSLPDLSGVEVTRRLRMVSDVPLVMLTARRQEVDKVVGLDAGADDYLTKPFETNELLARIRARLRRRTSAVEARPSDEGVIVIGGLELDTGTRRVTCDGRPIGLSAREFDILRLLAEAKGRVVERPRLFATVWGANFFGNERALDVYVRLLRGKIEPSPSSPQYLHTVRGVGYRLAYEASANEVTRSGSPDALFA